MIHEQRTPDSPGGGAVGYFPGGVYMYEKTFDAPADWANKTVLFAFEGVYQNAKVYINDQEAGGLPYGYVPFTVSADSFLNYGKENTIRVVADNSQMPNSRWYTGSGIYRPVWLYVADKNHIEYEGVKISTLSYNPARIRVDTAHTGGEVAVEISYADKGIVTGNGDSVALDIQSAKLWSADSPNLYQCRVTLSKDGVVKDEAIETFGIRKVEWSPKGLFINGQNTLLRGGCVHHDNGILGACSYAEAEERRVRIMKAEGFNAIRISHNPAAKFMLKACDKYGLYVIDETWDMWYRHKNKHDYAAIFMDWYKEDIRALVSRDFNHPSVIMYSIGNEVSEPSEDKGVKLAQELVQMIHGLDENRAVTAGINLFIIDKAKKGKGIYKEEGGRDGKKKEKTSGSMFFNLMASFVGTGMNKMGNAKRADEATTPCLDALDIAGYNYANGRYKMEGEKHPDRVIYGSETFPQDIAKNWAMVKEYPYLVGDFMWTAWDYLGEAGLGAWAYDGTSFNKPYPWLLAEAGVIDILGEAGAEMAYAQTVWGLRKAPYIGVRPMNHSGAKMTKAVWRGTNAMASWAWQGCEGNKAEVEVYADAASVALLVNGMLLGKKKTKAYKATFKTKYTPGRLAAVAYDAAGKEICRAELASATGKTRLQVKTEAETAAPGGLVYVDIALVGENGAVESNDDRKLTISVEGGTLLAFGSANPCTAERYDSGTHTTYYGRAQAIVRAGASGALRMSVSGEGLASTEGTVRIRA